MFLHMNKFWSNSFFGYTKSQRIGFLLLLVLCFVLQLFLFYWDFDQKIPENKSEKEWVALQQRLDVLKEKNNESTYVIQQFNPNFITDYKGYKLGMSVVEIDRLLTYRKQNKFVNSAKEFQNVTKISDSLLQKMAPNFKFPDWIKNKKSSSSYVVYEKMVAKKVVIADINQATAPQLMSLYGVGETLSKRILAYKNTVGGNFVSMDQIKEIWGLSPEVVEEVNKHFKIINEPVIKKIAINDASLKELSQFFYFKYALAKQILIYRSMNGDFKNIEDLAKIKGFPVEKANIINLYLDF